MIETKCLSRQAAASEEGVSQAAAILRRGGLVAAPTETVYGLAARADDPEAVAKIYRAKGRPSFNPLIVHVASLDQALEYAHFDESALQLARSVWPGALTLVLPLRANCSIAPAVTAGLPSIALRCPAHEMMRALITKCGAPLAAPSANRSGCISPSRADHVMQELAGRIDMVMDGGPCEQGIESTIVAIRENGIWDVLRPGPVDIAALQKQIIGEEITHTKMGTNGRDCDKIDEKPQDKNEGDQRDARNNEARQIESPGQMTRHYAPNKKLRLEATSARDDEFMIGFGAVPGDISLSQSGDLAEAARRLYSALREADAAPLAAIAVAPIAEEQEGAEGAVGEQKRLVEIDGLQGLNGAGGLVRAINDRLRRAAA